MQKYNQFGEKSYFIFVFIKRFAQIHCWNFSMDESIKLTSFKEFKQMTYFSYNS